MRWIAQENETIEEFLIRENPTVSKSSIREWIAQERISINGQNISRGASLESGDEIRLGARIARGAQGIRILFRNSDLVVIDKPARLLSVAAAYEKELCALQLLRDEQKLGEFFAVHRLDRETSGLLCFARNLQAQKFLKERLADHEVQREYLAVIEGSPSERYGSWESWLWEDPVSYQVFPLKEFREGAQWAVTHYEVAKCVGSRTLLRIRLETGRKHQIRVHCAAAGFPIVGDPRYGRSARRLGLHAERLILPHPRGQEPIFVECDAPKEFYELLSRKSFKEVFSREFQSSKSSKRHLTTNYRS